MSGRFIACCLVCATVPAGVRAQTPTGAILGTISDSSRGAITETTVQVVNHGTHQSRSAVTDSAGVYAVPALPAGEYDVIVEAAGFQRAVRTATVETGTTTRVDVVLEIAGIGASIAVSGAVPQMHYDSASVAGVVTRHEIDALPLNDRNYLELAKLEPGVQAPSAANRNRSVVPVLGAPAQNVAGPRFTIDGGSVTAVGLAGSAIGLSQEAVQEFQVSSVNFDLAAGMTHAGAITVVTRSGANTPSGSAFYFYRDHRLSAYPALARDPANPDPFFQRQQFGLALGGPIRRDRIFYFGSWERNDQRSVTQTTLVAPDFAALSRITSNPLVGTLFSVRVDARIHPSHMVFLRTTHDGSDAFGPAASIGGGSPNAYPSNWNTTRTGADQAVGGLTSTLTPAIVNDLRVSYFRVGVNVDAADQTSCPGCLGIGAPTITVQQAGLTIGNSSTLDTQDHRFELNDSLVWQKRQHRIRIGADWEWNRDRNLAWSNEPATVSLFSPDRVRAFDARAAPDLFIPLPATFKTLDDVLRLPIRSVTVSVGDPAVAQSNGTAVRPWNTVWLYSEDNWRLTDVMSVSLGVGWGFDGVLNHDLTKPALLAPILGLNGLGPTKNTWTNFAPAASLVWRPGSDARTVIHAGAGRYWGPQGLTSSMDAERVALGPPGTGRQTYAASSILNPLANIPGVPAGTPLDFTAPTLLTGAQFLAVLPAIRAQLTELTASNANPSVQQIQIVKQQPTPAIFPMTVPSPSAIHVNAGVQRELGHGLVLSADLVYRHFAHVPQNGGAIDLNHFESSRGPVIPRCDPSQANDPAVICSNGPIDVMVAPYHSSYTGLLLRVDRRLSSGIQLRGSYAYSHNTGTNAGNGFNLDDWEQNRGPLATDVTHLVNVAGSIRLPARFDLGFNFSYASAPPFSAFLSGFDLNGDGTAGDLLPGSTVNAFGRGLGRADLSRLVAAFNQTYAGTVDANGAPLPVLTVPASYAFGDSTHTLDLRLTQTLTFRGRARVTLIGEVFNVYNASNLSGFSGDLTSAAFGQPTARATQVFGSAGPRSFQLGIRASF